MNNFNSFLVDTTILLVLGIYCVDDYFNRYKTPPRVYERCLPTIVRIRDPMVADHRSYRGV